MKFYKSKAGVLNWLSDFYVECGYGGTFNGADDVYYAIRENIIEVCRFYQNSEANILPANYYTINTCFAKNRFK